VPFLIWGAEFDRVLSLEGARAWMEQYGRWAWLAGMGLVPGRADSCGGLHAVGCGG
jgi:hypothetical protein